MKAKRNLQSSLCILINFDVQASSSSSFLRFFHQISFNKYFIKFLSTNISTNFFQQIFHQISFNKYFNKFLSTNISSNFFHQISFIKFLSSNFFHQISLICFFKSVQVGMVQFSVNKNMKV